MWARAALAAALSIAAPVWGQLAQVHAQARDARAALRLAILEPVDAAVYGRIAGQSADLAWELKRVAGVESGEPLQRASRVGSAEHARAVLWITRDPRLGISLHLYDCEQQRLFERDFAIEAGAGAMAESAAFEALALSLRSALRALAADEPVGTPLDRSPEGHGTSGANGAQTDASSSGSSAAEGARTDPGAGTAEQPRAAHAADLTEQNPDAALADHDRMRAALVLAAGWAGALDGQSPIQHGPFVAPGLVLGEWVELRAHAQLGLSATLADSKTRSELRRRAVLAGVSVRVLRVARVSVDAGVLAGLVSFARTTTTSVASGLVATKPADTLAFAAELELRARLELYTGAVVRAGVELGASVLAVPARPLLRYQAASGPVDQRLWALEPQLLLGPFVLFSL